MKNKTMLITGGAGFIGSNSAVYFAAKGWKITVYDNLTRLGTKENASWLKKNIRNINIIKGDIRNFDRLKSCVKTADIILHLAAQVAVTTSVSDPRNDFEINALGTFNVLEAARLSIKKPFVIFASTNKVYGGMERIKIVKEKTRYRYRDLPWGISEEEVLDFHSPYGCSKGAADQYVRDYSRIYGLRTCVMRQSCIYGPRQFGVEDQGWVAWFLIASALGKKLYIYGDGKQVRDLLNVDDLVRAYEAVINNEKKSSGRIYNVGGGPDNTLSVWQEFEPLIKKLTGKDIEAVYSDWRPGDQPVYISDIRKIKKELSWRPLIKVERGIGMLYQWIKNNEAMFNKLFP